MSASQLALAVNVSRFRISQIKGGESCSPALALAIEDATGGALSASDLSPVIAQARQTGAAS